MVIDDIKTFLNDTILPLLKAMKSGKERNALAYALKTVLNDLERLEKLLII